MAARLPPLGTLRAFEAAARLESFSRAAEEISVTHSAVSHQVRALERALGTSLFQRNGRRVALTAAGRHFADRVGAALREIGEAAQYVRRGSRDKDVLTISTLPSFAARWLLPRLGRFMERHPQIAVTVHTSNRLVDLERDEVDFVIRFGTGNWHGVEAQIFMEDEFFPVASPRLNGGRLPRRPADLARFRLMRSGDEPWAPWFRAAGVKLEEPRDVFTDSSLLLQAAVDGRGIALARRSITEDELRAGQLVRLFDIAIPARGANYLAWPKGKLSPNAALLRDWLLAERDREAKG
jgi:LysR family transcriptional regulator, glycine cleavage system transcriptional activator